MSGSDGPRRYYSRMDSPTQAQPNINTYSVTTDKVLLRTQAAHREALAHAGRELAEAQQQTALYESIAEDQAVLIGQLRAQIAAQTPDTAAAEPGDAQTIARGSQS